MSDLSGAARTAAGHRAVAYVRHVPAPKARELMKDSYMDGFIECASRIPSRDEIAASLSTQTTCDGEPFPSELHYRQADAVLALIEARITG